MMRLRFASPEDAAALLEIYRPYVEETTVSFETEVPSLAEFRRRIAEIAVRFPYLVAEDASGILGYAYAHPFHERAAFQWFAEVSVYVRRDMRGKGVGRALYSGLLPLLRLQGIQTVCAVITIPNDPSLSFHKAMGFQQNGLLPDAGYKLGIWCSVAYLTRRLVPLGTPRELVPVTVLDASLIAGILEAAEKA